jgi:phosphate transport system protein
MIQEHTSKSFDTDIEGMRSAVLKIGGLVEQQVIRACDALLQSNLNLVAQVLADEEIVNQLHVQADMLCQQVIARRQPIAVDLREVIAALHSINDLERIGDEAKKIALKARHLVAHGPKAAANYWAKEQFQQMSSIASEMLSAALDAYVRHDSSVAVKLAARDQMLDALREQLNGSLLEHMAANSDEVQASMEMVFAVQALERVGDHAKNIAEYVVSVVEGVDMRHLSPNI